VVRRATPPAPRFLRVAPLLAGLGILAFFLGSTTTASAGSSNQLVFTVGLGFLVTLVGIVLAGPWITMVFTRALAARAQRVSSVIATRRLADDPARAFRAVSGIVVAVFAGSVFYGVAGTAIARGGLQMEPSYASAALVASPASANALLPSQRLIDALDRTSGMVGAMPLYAPASGNGLANTLLAPCPALDRTGVIGHCSNAGGVAHVPIDYGGAPLGDFSQTTVWPSQPNGGDTLSANPMIVFVLTDGTPAAVERARTMVEVAFGVDSAPRTVAELKATDVHIFTELQAMVDVGTLLTLLIAGCSLAVAVATGLLERKRPFTLLRVTGAPLRDLRAIVLLEAALPLLVMSVASALLGLLVSNLILRALLKISVAAPSGTYYALVACGVAGALAIVAATLPLLSRLTSPDTVRFE